jgi:hypothetical protein
VIPEHGVVLVVTDERGCETCFGFFRYPAEILDVHGRGVITTELGDTWVYRDFVDSPDPRYRRLVEEFATAGYTKQVKDEFA